MASIPVGRRILRHEVRLWKLRGAGARLGWSILLCVLVLGGIWQPLVASASGTGTLTPPHSDVGVDTNGDKLYNYLRIDVALNIAAAGTFTVLVVLNDDLDLAKLTDASVTVFLSTGNQRVSVFLDGADIYNGGVDGPYFAHLSLLNDLGNLLSSDVHKTAVYKFTDFQPFDAQFVQPSSERTLDNDSDGLVNWIVLTFTVQVATAGSYKLSSLLTDSTYTVSETWSQVRQLAPGRYGLEQFFLGYPLRLAARNGPYMVTNSLYDSRGILIDFIFVKTAAYGYTSFETPPAWFAAPFSERGVDSDGDGLYNNLRIDVGLGFEIGGTYTLAGRLLTGGGALIADTVARLSVSAGTMTASLSFKGSAIFSAGADGPYLVDLRLYDDALRKLDGKSYWTAAYSHLQFQPQLLYFNPPHKDAGVDFDNDGKYDVLRLMVGTYFNVPGKARVVAGLREGGISANFTQSSATVDLPAGPHTINVDINGSALLAAGIGGSYYVQLSALDAKGNLVDMDQFRTEVYDLSQFEAGAQGQILGLKGDAAEDADGNGLYNRLKFDFQVNVTAAGRYRLQGNLSKGSTTIANGATVMSLGPGAAIMSLRFSGREIRAAGLSGPYNVTASLSEANGTVSLDSKIFPSSPYAVSSFELAIPVRLSGLVASEYKGLPLANATVWLLDYSNQVSRIATTDAQGRYALPAYAGAYWFIVDHPEGQAQAAGVKLTGDATLDAALGFPRRHSVEDDVVWTGWDNLLLRVRYVYETDSPSVRFGFDWWNGNRDGWVQSSEIAGLLTPPDRFREIIDNGSSGSRFSVNGVEYLATGAETYADEVSGSVDTPQPPTFLVAKSFASRFAIGTPSQVAIVLDTYYDNATVDYGTWLYVPGSYRFATAKACTGMRVYARIVPYLVDPSPLAQPNATTMVGSCEIDMLPQAYYGFPTPAAPSDLSVSVSGSLVNLTWARPTENLDGGQLTNLAGYHVYRATSVSGPYVRIDAQLRTSESFMDSPGPGTFYYAVTAVSTDGVEGPPSSAVQATVDSPRAAATAGQPSAAKGEPGTDASLRKSISSSVAVAGVVVLFLLVERVLAAEQAAVGKLRGLDRIVPAPRPRRRNRYR